MRPDSGYGRLYRLDCCLSRFECAFHAARRDCEVLAAEAQPTMRATDYVSKFTNLARAVIDPCAAGVCVSAPGLLADPFELSLRSGAQTLYLSDNGLSRSRRLELVERCRIRAHDPGSQVRDAHSSQ